MYKWLLISLALISCSDVANVSGDGNKFVFVGKAPVIFSEIYAANADYKDEFGEKPGWVEFYNPADTVVNLKGYSLTNNKNEILWTFGEADISPRGYLTVFLSGKDSPDLRAPRDSINLIDSAIGAGSWADSANTPAGYSTARYSFSKSAGISGTLFTKDNYPVLEWSSAEAVLKFKDWDSTDVIDISGSNQILLRGYLSKDSKLEVRLAQLGMNAWESWPAVIKGTGVQNDLYTIELPAQNATFPDLKHIRHIRFSNVANHYGTIEFSFNSVIAQKRESDVHVSFKLNKSGGRLFLTDSLLQIRDSVAYPAETRGLSFANFENGKWKLAKPTPNSANSNESYEEQAQLPANNIPPSGYYERGLSFTLPAESKMGIIRCDTSGAAPNMNSILKAGVTLNITRTTVLRCAQFKNNAYPSEPIMRTYITGRLPDLPIVSIAVEPKDMFDSITGIYQMGLNASTHTPYYGANYWEDKELPVQIDFFEKGAKHVWSHSAEIKIFGNWSRVFPKKSVAIGFKGKYGVKKLNYPIFPERPYLTKFNWLVLRNNGGNFYRDYIRDMLMTSLTEGLGIDYQKGRAVVVYYNGDYYGIHNLRERINKDYFESNYGIDKSFLDLIKGNNEVSSGSDADYQEILQWIAGIDMKDDENVKRLESRIDLDNYTNYLQSEIYFINKDWLANNLKRWRSNMSSSKWKWLLYDTDFGFDGSNPDKSVKMLDFVTEPNGPDYPNPPRTTLITRKLLENSNYRNAFINRFSLLLATYYAPERVENRINYLMNAIEREIPLDQQRWGLNATVMNTELTTIKNFGKNRPAQMQKEIEEFFTLSNPINITLSAKGNGKILVHNLPVLNGKATFKAYSSVPIKIKAVPNAGASFYKWSDNATEAERTVTVEQAMTLEAEFR